MFSFSCPSQYELERASALGILTRGDEKRRRNFTSSLLSRSTPSRFSNEQWL
jgi:hypothetical protein